ncbi:MAG: UDP-4-amino-4,6-dideoxy-N-acetyl-beta-L-altrosamine transaminase [Acidobacteria bacterium]|nr:MAG: UDP-4-amino-4,6-dideoxy-N-acetyl-beta-L-altrosamine transaminase [Acidobacteriota bacterium]
MTRVPFIPFHRASIGPEEIEAVQKVLASGWLTTGPVAQEFERNFAAYIGCKHALAVNSGTAALQLALDVIGLVPGDEVLIPTYTFTATAEVVTYYGARPVLCDSVPDGFNLDVSDAERRITAKTRAIIPVHVAGEPCDMEAVQALARRHHLRVIEDAAHALPSTYRGRRIGTVSELTAFSFYATKTLTTAEGGMLTTDDDNYARRIHSMRLHGISGHAWNRYAREGSWYYEVENAGHKLNMPDVLAALGVAQVAKCDRFLWRRRTIAARYNAEFSANSAFEVPPDGGPSSLTSWHLYILRIRPHRFGLDRNGFIDALKLAGIGTSVHFIPLHLHPYYQRAYGYKLGDFPNAEDAYSRCLSLPIFPDLTDAEVDRIIATVLRIAGEHDPEYQAGKAVSA